MKKPWILRHFKDIFVDIALVILVIVSVVVAGLFIWISTLEIPDLSAFEERRILQSTKIFDRTGEILLYDLHQDVRRTIVPFESISRHLKNATVAIEDDQFYNHFGIDIRAIIRAALANMSQGDLLGGQGGSTITQQVIKNSLLDQDKKLTRKVKEAILSIKLEQLLTKDEILWHYLNESPYGGTIYGVEEASQSFFGKSASELGLAEAAYMAAIPQAPTRLSPYGNNRDLLDQRKDLVLERMLVNNFITSEEYEAAKETDVEFEPQAITGIRAPHFVMFIREQLVEKYGEEALTERGFRVITTLDWELQKEAERIVAEKAESNTERFNASNAGLVATDPQTGDVLVMVGSRDYFSDEIDGNFNVALAKRQPGSSIKPFVYAAALTRGYLPDTIVFDVPTQFSPKCDATSRSSESPCYAPNNYNGKFKGPINLRSALAQSLNIPAVKVLYLAGVNSTLKLAADMGLTTLNDPERYGLTLVLGGGEVRLLDMTHAYGVFANKGIKAEPRSIIKVETMDGTAVEENDTVTSRVLDEDVALMMTDILSDNVARTPLWGSNSLINFTNRDVAAKSGSTNNLRDAWIMGYTPNLAVGAWVGNNDNAAMGGGLSGLITTPMWREFMDVALEKIPDEKFSQPPTHPVNLKPILVGSYVDSGLILQQMSSDEGNLDLAIIAGNIHTILHFVNKEDPRGPYPQNPQSDPQYDNWEYAVRQWKNETFGAALNREEGGKEEEKEEEDN